MHRSYVEKLLLFRPWFSSSGKFRFIVAMLLFYAALLCIGVAWKSHVTLFSHGSQLVANSHPLHHCYNNVLFSFSAMVLLCQIYLHCNFPVLCHSSWVLCEKVALFYLSWFSFLRHTLHCTALLCIGVMWKSCIAFWTWLSSCAKSTSIAAVLCCNGLEIWLCGTNSAA